MVAGAQWVVLVRSRALFSVWSNFLFMCENMYYQGSYYRTAMVPEARIFRGYQTCQRLDGKLLVRKSYKLSIRSRILKSRVFSLKWHFQEKYFSNYASSNALRRLQKCQQDFGAFLAAQQLVFTLENGTIVHNFFTFSVQIFRARSFIYVCKLQIMNYSIGHACKKAKNFITL